MRHLITSAALLTALVTLRGAAQSDIAAAWYPLTQTGNTWVYADESRNVEPGFGIGNPTVGRWTTTETVVAATPAADGIHVTVRATISDLVRENGWPDDPGRLTPVQTLLLVRGNCIYQPRPPFRLVWTSDDHPAFCFPLTAGGEFGRTPTTPPDEEDVWKVGALNGDPFGAPGRRTFRVYGFQGSGDTTDYWFQEGVGVVQFVEVHHGTYDEYRRRLVKTTIDGVTTTYALEPARTPPFDAGECRTGWQRWVRHDGTLLHDRAACEAYARSRR